MHPTSEQAETRTAVSVRDLHFSYGRSPTVLGAKLDLPTGCVVSLLGHSGAGKSTLLALLAGALPRAQGTVAVGGQDPNTSAGRQLVGYMPQIGGLYPAYTVEENLRTFAIGGGPHGSLGAAMSRLIEPVFIAGRRAKMINDAVERTLAAVELTSRRHEIVGRMSAAHQQRVSLGIALLWDAEVLLLDDPLAMADDAWANQLWKRFRELAARNRTVVFSTGRAGDAAKADRVLLMRAGRVTHSGLVSELAPSGRARVALKYVQKTGPLAEEVEVENLATELPSLMERKPNLKPLEVHILQDSPEVQLQKLLEASPAS